MPTKPRLTSEADVFSSIFGGIFQSMLDRRLRGQQVEDRDARFAQQNQLQQSRQGQAENMFNMRAGYEDRVRGEKYKREDELAAQETADEWFENFKKIMSAKKSAKSNKALLQKHGITPSDDPKVNQIVLPAIMLSKAGVTKSGGVIGDKPMDFLQALALAQKLHRNATSKAQGEIARAWVASGATKTSVAPMTEESGELFSGGRIPQEPPDLNEMARNTRNLATIYGSSYTGYEKKYSGLSDYITNRHDPQDVQRQIAGWVSAAMQNLLSKRDEYEISDELANNQDAMHKFAMSHAFAGLYLAGIGNPMIEDVPVYNEFDVQTRNKIGQLVASMQGQQKDITRDVVPGFTTADTANAAFTEALGMNVSVFPPLPGVDVSLDDILVKMFTMDMDDEQMAALIHYILKGPPSDEPGGLEKGFNIFGSAFSKGLKAATSYGPFARP